MKKPSANMPPVSIKATDANQKNKQEIDNMSDEEVLAMNAYNPVIRAITGGQAFTKNITGEVDLFASIAALGKQVAEVHNGNLTSAEQTLAAQANTLDLLFNSLVCKAANAKLLNHFEAYMRLALKAQSQCRTTYETLTEIKNPRSMAFIKQQNIGVNQQVNNDTNPRAYEESIYSSNELLERQDGERLDTRTSGETIGTDKKLETMEIFNGSKDI
jgi:hypothetical protein